MITVEYRGPLAQLCGCRTEQGDFTTAGQVLRHVRQAHGAAAWREAKKMLVTVDGTSILLLRAWRTPLEDGQAVSFLPICGIDFSARAG